jgi:hypothetical protein
VVAAGIVGASATFVFLDSEMRHCGVVEGAGIQDHRHEAEIHRKVL